MMIANITILGWIHTIACLVAIVAGAWVLIGRKGTRIHRRWGWWYAGSMVVLNLSILAVYRFDIHLGKPPQAGPHIFGIFHWMAVATLASALLAVFAASRQKRAVWAHVHAQAMLFSYYLLIGGLINEMVVRIPPLRRLAMALSPHAINPATTLLAREGQTACMMIWMVLAVWFVIKVMRDRSTRVPAIGFPMRYSGGCFIACAGAGILLGALVGAIGYGFMIGAIIGFVAMSRARRLVAPLWGRPTTSHMRVMVFAIGLEVVIFALLGSSGVLAKWSFADTWEITMAIVGFHFLIMRFSHGALMLPLGLCVLAWLGVGHQLHLPLQVVAAGDGILKLGFGLYMAWPLLKSLRQAQKIKAQSLPGYPLASGPAPAGFPE